MMYPPIIILRFEPVLSASTALLVWLLGVGLLASTRLTSALQPRMGHRYYLVSAVLRPLGIVLIGFGFANVAVQRVDEHHLPFPPHFQAVGELLVIGLLLALGRQFFPFLVAAVLALVAALSSVSPLEEVFYRPGYVLAATPVVKVLFWEAFLLGLVAVVYLAGRGGTRGRV